MIGMLRAFHWQRKARTQVESGGNASIRAMEMTQSHQTCRYSQATRGNIDVGINGV
jgi:organic hydroperoxide reductase OsmC/OhrA